MHELWLQSCRVQAPIHRYHNYRGPKQQVSKRLLDANLKKALSDDLALTERNGNEGGEGCLCIRYTADLRAWQHCHQLLFVVETSHEQ